ncbi:lipoteichoic acid stability factor AuxA, partial [Mammaliicoccus sciuri]|uniref:lipoteichoic acid stability factor AuxA n=1 Tax=Mammaliicoccus sciuri TaxID=1296 RepID=UPI003BF99888
IWMIVIMMTMFQVYSFASFLFIIPFAIHVGYVVYKNELNPMHRKKHYLWIIISYGLCYFISQFAMNHNIDTQNVKPIDVMSVNLFFILLWCLSQMSVWISLYLRRSLPVSDEDIEQFHEERYSRVKNNRLTRKIYTLAEGFYQKLQNFKQATLEKFNSEEAIAKRKRRNEKWKEIIKIEEDDIPRWMRRPKWLKKSYIEWIMSHIHISEPTRLRRST